MPMNGHRITIYRRMERRRVPTVVVSVDGALRPDRTGFFSRTKNRDSLRQKHTRCCGRHPAICRTLKQCGACRSMPSSSASAVRRSWGTSGGVNQLSHPLGELARIRVDVSLEHTKVLVTGNRGELDGVELFFSAYRDAPSCRRSWSLVSTRKCGSGSAPRFSHFATYRLRARVAARLHARVEVWGS